MTGALEPAGAADRVAFGLKLGLGFLALAGLYGLPWLALAPNRLLPGRPVLASMALGPAMHIAAAALVLALVLARSSRDLGGRLAGPLPATGPRSTLDPLPAPGPSLALGLVLAAMLVLVGLTGEGASRLLSDASPVARVALGPGFWTAILALAVLAVELARETGGRHAGALAVLVIAGAVAGLFQAGMLDALSLAVEAHARADLLTAALARHLLLAATALLAAVALALPLGWSAFRSPRAASAIGAVLSAVQVVPAIALFGLLVPLLALLLAAAPALREAGLAAIGPAPALIGVTAYLTLPLVRGLAAGLGAADPAVVEAARAMGFTDGRILREVRVPLGLPVLAGALRVAAVQSVGLTTLGGLIGAGGLGALVFEGMAQFAPDLILLAAVPVVILAVVVDVALAALAPKGARSGRPAQAGPSGQAGPR